MPEEKSIIVLAGGVSRGGKLGWRSSVFGEVADISLPGSYVRIPAAYFLWSQDKTAVVVTSGGRGQADRAFPSGLSLSSIMKEELKELGMPESAILEENQSGNTYQQLCAITNMVAKHGWSEISIVSSRYHLPRVQTMVECLSELEALKAITKYVSAEEVVLATEPDKWREQIELAYQSGEFAEEISKAESRGIAQIRAGTYQTN